MLSVVSHGVLLAVPYMTRQLGRATCVSAGSDLAMAWIVMMTHQR